jgi:hypothetical protein
MFLQRASLPCLCRCLLQSEQNHTSANDVGAGFWVLGALRYLYEDFESQPHALSQLQTLSHLQLPSPTGAQA